MASKNITPVKIESEKSLERKLKKEIERLNGFCIKLLALHISGIPDRLCLLPGGRIFFAEIKTTKQKPKAIQLLIHARLRSLGFKVYVIDTSDKILSAITDQILNAFKDHE